MLKSGTNRWPKLQRKSNSARVEEWSGSASGKRYRRALLIYHRAQGVRKDEDFPRWLGKCVWCGENQVPVLNNSFNWNLRQSSYDPMLAVEETQSRKRKVNLKYFIFFSSKKWNMKERSTSIKPKKHQKSSLPMGWQLLSKISSLTPFTSNYPKLAKVTRHLDCIKGNWLRAPAVLKLTAEFVLKPHFS